MNKGIILAVDDNYENLKLLGDILEAEGYQVRQADSGELALAAAVANPPDLILLDIRMAGMDGFEVCRRLKSKQKTCAIPIIFISVATESEERVEGLTLGAVDFISKPFQREELLVRVQNHLQLSRLHSQLEQQAAYLQIANKQLQIEINERKLSEEALLASEEKYRLLIKQIPAVVFKGYSDWSVDVFDDKMEHLTGYTKEEFDSHKVTWRDLIPVEDLPYVEGVFREALKADKSYLREHRIRRKDGRIRWVQCRGKILCRPDGEVDYVSGLTFDITEGKRTEEALRESELRFRTLFDNAADGFLVANQESKKFILGNAMISKMLGYSLDEIRQIGVHDIHPPEDLPFVLSQFDKQSIQISLAPDLPVLRKDGSVFYADINVFPIILEGKTCTMGIFRDITDRKRAKDALKESEERLKFVLEGSQLGFWDWNINTGEVQRNDYWAQMLGYSLQEIEFDVGQWDSLIHPDDRALAWKTIQDHLEGQTPAYECEYRMLTKDGQYRWILDRAKIVERDQEGRPLRMSGTHTDISKRKRIEEELLVSEERYRVIFEGAVEGIIASDLQSRTLSFANPASCAMFGYQEEDFLRLNISDLHPEEAVPQVLIEFDALACGKKKLAIDIPCRRKDNSLFFVDITATQTTILNKHYLVGFFNEITERKQAEAERAQLEAELLQYQKMQAVGTLAGGIAHEFNNIMGIIMGFTEMAMLNLGNPAKQKSQLEHVLKGSHRARDLVKQILAFSRPSELKLSPIKLGAVVKETLKMLESTLPTSVEIRLNVLSEGMAQADFTQIQQVLINLCSNASQAMRPEGGILEISLNDVQIDTSFHPEIVPGSYIRLSVRDTGSGMTPEVRDRIFEPFFTTKEVGAGTGLGLSVTYGIMKGCGGAITVESEPGQGSTFHLFFPLIQDRIAVEPSQPILCPQGKERILFVDDEAELVNLGQEMLESLGYQAICLRSSLEALEVFRAHPKNFDLVITDQTMPHMSGNRLAKELMRLRPDIPVILCTGFSEVITAEQAREMGIKAFLMKPVVVSELAKVIRSVLD